MERGSREEGGEVGMGQREWERGGREELAVVLFSYIH